MVRFLMETYPEGIDRIQGRDLFKQWCDWCAQVRHESGSETRFGGLIKKVRVGVGVDAKGVAVRVSKGRKVYTVTPMQDFPLGAYFGVVTVIPHLSDNPHPNPHPTNQPEGQDSEQRGDRGDSSSLNLERFEKIDKRKEESPISPIETLYPPEPSPLSPTHPADAFSDATWATSSESFISAQKPIPVHFSGTDGAHLIGKIPGDSPDKDLMVVQTPTDKIVGCKRSDFTHKGKP